MILCLATACDFIISDALVPYISVMTCYDMIFGNLTCIQKLIESSLV